jgi:excisionase family DNA binding protein
MAMSATMEKAQGRKQGMTRVVREELPAFLDANQAAAIISVSPKFIRDRCQDGTIKAVKCGRVWRIHRDAFLEQFGLIG